MIWLISDTHFNHENIIDYGKRPFQIVAAMNATMIQRWNKAVKPDDTVFHLGDFAFGNSVHIKFLLDRLPGRKILIRGNHDHKGNEALMQCGFLAVLNYARIEHIGLSIGLNHRPLDELPLNTDCVFHGHLHQGRAEDQLRAGENPLPPLFNLNLSVEKTGYAPISLPTAIKMLEKQWKGSGYTKS